MDCPLDGAPLTRVDVEAGVPGLAGFACGKCTGHWLRFGDYLAWRDRQTGEVPEVPGEMAAETVESSGGPARRCPDCGHLLTRYRVGPGRFVRARPLRELQRGVAWIPANGRHSANAGCTTTCTRCSDRVGISPRGRRSAAVRPRRSSSDSWVPTSGGRASSPSGWRRTRVAARSWRTSSPGSAEGTGSRAISRRVGRRALHHGRRSRCTGNGACRDDSLPPASSFASP